MTNPGAVVFDRDGVAYQVVISERYIWVVGGLVSELVDYRWPERVEHPWMWGKPIGSVVEEFVDRAHRKHLRQSARTRDLEELRRQLASRETRR